MTRCAAALSVALALSSTAQAQDPRALGDPAEEPRELPRVEAPPDLGPLGLGWAVDLCAQTSLPLSVGLEARLITPIGITAHFAGGHTPAAYLDAIATIMRDNGVYEESMDPLVREATASGAWNVRGGLGFTVAEGLEIDAGYTFITTDSRISLGAIESATGFSLVYPGLNDVPLSIRLHAFHARLGWRFVIENHFVIRFALGWTHVVESEVSVTVPPEIDPLGGPADQREQEIYEGIGQYGFSPEILLSAGYRF